MYQQVLGITMFDIYLSAISRAMRGKSAGLMLMSARSALLIAFKQSKRCSVALGFGIAGGCKEFGKKAHLVSCSSSQFVSKIVHVTRLLQCSISEWLPCASAWRIVDVIYR
jgi:hypothetical protein